VQYSRDINFFFLVVVVVVAANSSSCIYIPSSCAA
jgi:hypothetical protein